MSNETPSERSDWRERLDQPGEAWTGREAAWDKLYDRLHQKENISRRKRHPIYWVAAAAALLVISLGIVHEKQRGVEGTSPAGRATDAPAVARNGRPAGNEQPVGNGQPAGNEQSVGNVQPTGNEQPVGNGQPTGNEQSVGNGQPTGNEQSVGNGQPAGNGQPVGSGQPVGNEQPGSNEQPVANAHPIQQNATGMPKQETYADGQHPRQAEAPTVVPSNDPAPIAPADAPPIVAQSTPPAQPHPVQSRPVAARLPVVSINELGTDESTQSGGGSKSSSDHYLQIKLINNQTYTETASENGRRSASRIGLDIHR